MVWVAGGVVLLLVAVVLLYNQLVRAKVKVRQAWAQLDTQLQRRHDLIPNLVATVNAYATHERDLLDAVTQARAAALAIADPIERRAAEDHLGAVLGQILLLSENYPDLKADANFRLLQTELSDTEDRLSFARDFANDRVARYRKLTDTLPGLIIAGPMGFPREALFCLQDQQARQRPDVQLEQ
jgi:LemA protein